MKRKILSVIGSRPQVFKIDPTLSDVFINTGQHADEDMFGQHLKEMKLKIKYNLGCTSDEIGRMIDRTREVLRKEKPDVAVVYGDTYSTFAGAVASSMENIPLAHVEAGLRSHDKSMPEETNRIVADVLASWRFAPTHHAMNNLLNEGMGENSYYSGDSLFWSLNRFLPLKKTKDSGTYIFASIHRRENLQPEKLKEIFEGFGMIDERIYLPLHPHTRRVLKKNRIKIPKNIEVVKPQPRSVTLSKIHNCRIVITDSGGVQREAFWLLKHSLIIRSVTEWEEIMEKGWGTLVPPIAQRIAEAAKEKYIHNDAPDFVKINPYEIIKNVLNA